MEQKRSDEAKAVDHQAKRMRSLYSQLKQPLPADVIIDLYLHLGKALVAGTRETKASGARRSGSKNGKRQPV